MGAIDEYMKNNYTMIDGDDFSQYPYHQHWYSQMDSELKAYAKEQMDAGAKMCITHPNANGIDLICPVKANDGQTYYITQGLYNDPRDNTFITCILKGGGVVTVNRSRQCAGLDITDTGTILKRALVCDKCGEPVESFEELNFVLYAGAECDECSKASWEYINSKPAGYWTE